MSWESRRPKWRDMLRAMLEQAKAEVQYTREGSITDTPAWKYFEATQMRARNEMEEAKARAQKVYDETIARTWRIYKEASEK